MRIVEDAEADLAISDPESTLALPQIDSALAAVRAERLRQDERWGWFRDYADGTGADGVIATVQRQQKGKATWASILGEEVFEVLVETDEKRLEKELTQVAAVATAWVEALRRRKDERRSAMIAAPWWRRLLWWR